MALVEIPEAFRTSPRWWRDPVGRRWLDDLPGLVEATCASWQLAVDGPVRHGSNALVVPVRTTGGPAALRLTPADARSADDLRALQFWRGGPVVGVIRSSGDGSTMLLDRLDAAEPLSAQPTSEIAEVLGGLVAALALFSPPEDVPSTTDLALTMAARGVARWRRAGRPVPEAAIHIACARARALAPADPGRAVNADLHADQVLSGGPGPWTVVDPTLWRGDPAYDLARALWTLADRLPDAASLRVFAASLVKSTGLDERHASSSLLVRTVDYWLWCVEEGLTEDPLRCARIVDALLRT